MDIDKLTTIASIMDKKTEVWIEDETGRKQPINDYEYDLENNRLILKV